MCFWFVVVKCFFELVNMYINSCVIVDPAFILYVGFENAACQFVGTHWKYFRVVGEGSSAKERIHGGRTYERKRSSLPHTGRKRARRGNEFEGYYYERWLQIHCVRSNGQRVRGSPPACD